MIRSSLPASIALSLIATVVFIILNGYAFGGSTQRLPGTSPSSDHANVLPQVYREYDAGLFLKDPQIRSGATFQTILWPIIGRLCPPERVNWAFFVLHVLCMAVSFALLWRLAAECCAGKRAATGGVTMSEGAQMPIIATPFAAQRMGHPRGALAGLLAIILFVVIRISPAAEPTLDTAFYTRGAALPLGLAAILLSLHGRQFWAAAFFMLTAAIHAITAMQVLCVCLPLALMSSAVSAVRRRLNVVALVAAVAVVWAGIETVTIPASLRPGSAWIAMQRAVNGSHLFVDFIPQSAWREFAVCALFLLPALSQPPGDRMRRLAAAALVGGMASVGLGIAGQFTETSILLQLSPLRGLKLTMILSLVSAAVMASRLIGSTTATGGAKSRVAAVAAGAALLALVCRQHYFVLGSFVVMTLAGDGAKWIRAASVLMAGAIAAWFIGFDATHDWEQSTRSTLLIAVGVATGVLMFVILSKQIGRIADQPDRVGLPRVGIVLASLAALGLVTIPLQRDNLWVYAARDYPWRQPSDPWAEAQRWIAANTPVDSLFLVPPWLEGFRTYARRSEFVEYKMGTLSLFHPAFGQEWAGRMASLTPRRLSGDGYEDMAMNYNALTADEIARMVEKFGITHVVVMASREDLPYRTVYQNALLRVLDIAR